MTDGRPDGHDNEDDQARGPGPVDEQVETHFHLGEKTG